MSCFMCKTKPSVLNFTSWYNGYLRNKSYTSYFCSEECKNIFNNTRKCCKCGYSGTIGKELSKQDGKVYCNEDWYGTASCLKSTIIRYNYYIDDCNACSGDIDDILDNIKKIYNGGVYNECKGDICAACYGKLCANILKVVDILDFVEPV